MEHGRYIYERSDWPNFRYNPDAISASLDRVQFQQGVLVGRLDALGVGPRHESTIEALVQEVRRSSEIEGELLDWNQVRSSIGRRLGIDVAGLPTPDRHVEGIVDVVLDATEHFSEPLTQKRLFDWHGALFPTGRSGVHTIVTAAWRDDRTGPMQIVSGPLGRQRVHFQAPRAETLDAEMGRFLEWFATDDLLPGLVKAGIAHLWFVTLHPFDEGNGRIGRAILDMALARSANRAWRGYSLSAQILRERNRYYDALEAAQTGNSDVTAYLEWYFGCLERALKFAEGTL